mgnify:CR=1 FL=1
MNYPALKGEVSNNKKMLTTINPRLRRSYVVLDSFHSCVPNTSKKLSRTPEMSHSEMPSQPRMLSKKFKGSIAFKQLKGFANTHCNRHLNEEMNVVDTNMEFINFESMFLCSFSDKEFTINSDQFKLERISCILGFPDKMECILSEGMFGTPQIHFCAPQTFIRNTVLTMFVNLVHRGFSPMGSNNSQELNLMERGNSSLCLKAEVSLPWM